ncbi:abortive infection family protein [Burkholderia gladioli]|uniref:abortive infection family protein n=1 Tax=Burkholderia gladioli TaxID=28095 RepID=UPI003F796B8B
MDIRTLAARQQQIKAKEAAQLERALALLAELNEVFAFESVHALSRIVTLRQTGPDSFIYGRLRYAHENLDVLYRSTDDDLADQHDGIDEDEQRWREMPLDGCWSEWRLELLDDQVLNSLIASIAETLSEREARLSRSLANMDAIFAAESAAIDVDMVECLAEMGDDTLSRLWQEAVNATKEDSADALTRCNRFLEAVCSAILRDRTIPLPKDKSAVPLVKACLDTLTWPAEKEAKADVRQLLGGIQSITQGISALRTHFGTAHGATSHLPPLDRGYAIFAKQATVAAATFLLDRHRASPTAASTGSLPDDSGPTPAD